MPNFPEPTEELCLAQGCCWQSLANGGVPCAFAAVDPPPKRSCAAVAKASRLACRNPRFASTMLLKDRDTCLSAGCCFDDGECFQPMADGYELLTLDETPGGWRGTLVLRQGHSGPFGNDVPLLELYVTRESPRHVRIRITDLAFPRYEVPGLPVRPESEDEEDTETASDYEVHFTSWPFGVAVTRRHSGEVLFNSTPPVEREDEGAIFSGLVFENQFLELSTQLSMGSDNEEPLLYGLGERVGPVRLHADSEGDHYPMFARAPNTSVPAHTRSGGDNLYGVHPFVLQLEGRDAGRAHGIFMLSSNALEAVTRRDALTFRLTGGVLDVFVFSGPSPQDVVEEYTRVVGRPALPPYWALGYHVGKRGGNEASVHDAENVVAQLRLAGVPMDAYWQDADYMADHGRPLSLNEHKFPRRDMRVFIDDLHFHSQHFMCVQVPAVSSPNASFVVKTGEKEHVGEAARYSVMTNTEQSAFALHTRGGDEWDPMARGKELDVFVKGVHGERYAEKAFWSRWAVFVDFFHPNASHYWHEQLAKFHEYVLPFDGLWLDMNEPSSTCDHAFAAEADICSNANELQRTARRLSTHKVDLAVGNPDEVTVVSITGPQGDGGFIRSNDVNFPFDPYRQPFVPGQNERERGGHGNLNSATLPMASLHHSSLHYNLHSLYGHAQARATRHALDVIVKKRSVLLSRSTFAGTGQYAGHWLGDDAEASWDQLRLSIAGTLQMNMLGIPLSGPNVCGSRGHVSKELCVRWHQAASFLPLLRNHASGTDQKQTPVDFDAEALNILRATLLRRYRYLPYMYTLFYQAHRFGSPVVRPLAFEFPRDKGAREIENQYLLGPALMVSPVMHEGAISVEVYFPEADWYDAQNGKLALTADTQHGPAGRCLSLLTPLPKLQLHIRGGFVVPMQQPQTTTVLSRRGAVTLLAALDTSQKHPSAVGELYVDDGESLSAVGDHGYSLLRFGVFQNSSNSLEFKSTMAFRGYAGPEMQADLNEVRVYGVHGDKGFSANSSLHATLVTSGGHSTPQRRPVKADYFAQANTLVITRLDVRIGQEFHVKVVARPATTRDGEEKDGGESVGANKSGHSRGEEGSKAKEEPSKKKKSMYSITGIVGIVVGCAFLMAIIFVFLLQRRRARQGYEAIG
ncbi:hypothetical protein BBJ28_00008056 [Nothophytophthora sp. Chile5]|nr:hypothetical protein BBJ28_00008056 [Nothophytophthora sp. Chile5]